MAPQDKKGGCGVVHATPRPSRDWLVRPACPLCAGDIDAGYATLFGNPKTPALRGAAKMWPAGYRKDEIAGDLCWWCIGRCIMWMGRHGLLRETLEYAEWRNRFSYQCDQWPILPAPGGDLDNLECRRRFHWAEKIVGPRPLQYEVLTTTDVATFVTYCLNHRSALKWLGNPNAFHPQGPRKRKCAPVKCPVPSPANSAAAPD